MNNEKSTSQEIGIPIKPLALTGASFVALMAILTVESKSSSLIYATQLFSFGIPVSILGVVIRKMSDIHFKRFNPEWYTIPTLLSGLACFVGLLFCVIHISEVAGLVFMVASGISVIGFIMFMAAIFHQDLRGKDEKLLDSDANKTTSS
ncbi:MAG: hypothetical protein AAGF87_12575 [Bacteroidota bacterium]